MAHELPIRIPDPHSLVAAGSFGGLSFFQSKLQQYESVEFLSNFQIVKPPAQTNPSYY